MRRKNCNRFPTHQQPSERKRNSAQLSPTPQSALIIKWANIKFRGRVPIKIVSFCTIIKHLQRENPSQPSLPLWLCCSSARSGQIWIPLLLLAGWCPTLGSIGTRCWNAPLWTLSRNLKKKHSLVFHFQVRVVRFVGRKITSNMLNTWGKVCSIVTLSFPHPFQTLSF